MGLGNEVRETFQAKVNSGNITYAVGLTDTPASGAPGAYKKMLANAGIASWWLVAFVYGNIVAGATVFDYQIARDEAGAGGIIAAVRILVAAASAAVDQHKNFPYPIATAAGIGAAARQLTASTKTLDVTIEYALGVGT